MRIQDGGSAGRKAAEMEISQNTAAKSQPVTPEHVSLQDETQTAENKMVADPEKVRQAVEALNKAVEVSLPNRLQFRLHEATDQMQVQIIDQESEKVIKEIPPQEILDLMARIHEMVGWFLDERI